MTIKKPKIRSPEKSRPKIRKLQAAAVCKEIDPIVKTTQTYPFLLENKSRNPL
jgi:hypothetical protein